MIRKPLVVALMFVLALALGFEVVALWPEKNGGAAMRLRPAPSPTFDFSGAAHSKPPRPERLPPQAPCQPLHLGFDGNPRKFRQDLLGRYRVPKGRLWHLTNTSLMMERYANADETVAGEWTGVVAAVHDAPWRGIGHNGTWANIATSSLDEGSGIALQGQGRVDVLLDEHDYLVFMVWLRPGNRPGDYYYSLGASGTDCPK